MTEHWLAEQVAALSELAKNYRLTNVRWSQREGATEAHESEGRMVYMDSLREVVSQINQRRGVLGCFVAHDGLLVEAAGEGLDFEALAAMTQWCVMPANNAAETLSLGNVQQILIIGSERKLALIQLGQMTLVASPLPGATATFLQQRDVAIDGSGGERRRVDRRGGEVKAGDQVGLMFE